MPAAKMLTVFTYDVSANRNRRKLAKILEGAAIRVQYSVFEAYLSRAKAEALAQHAASWLGEGDSLRVYVIGQDGQRRSRVYGDAAPMQDNADYWLI